MSVVGNAVLLFGLFLPWLTAWSAVIGAIGILHSSVWCVPYPGIVLGHSDVKQSDECPA